MPRDLSIFAMVGLLIDIELLFKQIIYELVKRFLRYFFEESIKFRF